MTKSIFSSFTVFSYLKLSIHNVDYHISNLQLMPIFSYEDTDVQTFNYVEVNSLVMSISNEWGNLFRTVSLNINIIQDTHE